MTRRPLRLTRDSFLFGFGVIGVTYEALAEQADKPTLLIVFAACMGLPVFLRADERKADPPSDPSDNPPSKEADS